MPYITTDKRKKYDSFILALVASLEQGEHSNGDLNYVISKLVHEWLISHPDGLRYDSSSDAYKAMVCAAAEFYRVVVAPYEDAAAKKNGPVSVLDNDTIALEQKTPRL